MRKSVPLCLSVLFCLGQSGFFCCAADSRLETEPNYHWGRGLTIPAANLNIGGYLDASFKHQQSEKDKTTLDDISLFISWSPHDRIHFFSEIELEDWLSNVAITKLGAALRVERLYVDLLATDSVKVRLGKFLTPFGIWNAVHAAPLVWTTTRPLVTEEQLFPSHVTGIMFSNTFSINEQNLDVSLYADDSTVFDPHKNTHNFDHAFGARLNYELLPQLQIGFSYLDFKTRIRSELARNHLVGLDLLWKKNDYELQMELSYRYAPDWQGDEKNFYLQAVAPLPAHLFAVGRYEYFAGKHQVDTVFVPGKTQLGILGLTWRPDTPLIFKTEYRFGTDNQLVAPSGFFTSISMFF